MTDTDDGFLSRWARRKAQVRSGIETPVEAPVRAVAVPETAVPRPSAAAPAASGPVPVAPALAPTPAPVVEPPPLPTMEDVARLTRSSDFASFVQPGIDPGVSNAAMKKLFSDPRYNVMDGLDTYIGDYNTPDPIPPAMLRQMNQAKFLGLFDDEDEGKDSDEDKNGNRDDGRNDKPTEETTLAAVTCTEALPATALRSPAHEVTGAPAAAPGNRADDDTDL